MGLVLALLNDELSCVVAVCLVMNSFLAPTALLCNIGADYIYIMLNEAVVRSRNLWLWDRPTVVLMTVCVDLKGVLIRRVLGLQSDALVVAPILRHSRATNAPEPCSNNSCCYFYQRCCA